MRQFNGEKVVLSTKIISHVNVKKKLYTDYMAHEKLTPDGLER